MATDPLTAVRASLRRLEELGLERPASLSIRDWFAALGSHAVVEPLVASEIADCYDSIRFGGNSVEPSRWQSLERALGRSIDRFEALEADRRLLVICKLRPVSRTAREPPSRPASKPSEPTAPKDVPAARPRRNLLLYGLVPGALALCAVTYIVLEVGADEPVGEKKRVETVPIPDIDLTAPTATYPGGFFEARIAVPGGPGRAVSLIDYDRDGDIDVFVASDAKLLLFDNRGTRLSDVSGALGLKGPARSGQWADVDSDGDLDLAITASGRQPMVFQNTGETFEAMPLAVPRPHNPEGLGWLDFDADGDADLLVTNGALGVHLFANVGGELIDVGPETGFGPEGWGRDNGDFIHFLDLNLDGRLDILYAATAGLAARNVDGQRFERTAVEMEFAMIDGTHKQAIALGDIDGDLKAEVFAPQRTAANLYENRGGAWGAAPQPELRGVLGNRARSAVFGDLDLDGDLDIVVATRGGGLELFENHDGTLRHATPESGFTELVGNVEILGLALGDLDGDGDSDLVFHSMRDGGGILINATALPPGRGLLHASFAKLPAPGTRIAVRGTSELTWQVRWLGVPTNAGSQQPLSIAFGLAAGPAQIQLRLTDGTLACMATDVVAGERTSVVIDFASPLVCREN